MEKEASPPNTNANVSRSSSTSLLYDFSPGMVQTNSIEMNLTPSSHLIENFVSQIDYKEFIISPEQACQIKENASSTDNNNNPNSDSQDKKNEINKKIKLIPISKAKDQVMQRMKLSNDEYISQVETMKRSEVNLEKITEAIKDIGPVKFDIMNHPIKFEIAMNNYTIDYCNEEIQRIKSNIDSYAVLFNEISSIVNQESSENQPQLEQNISQSDQSSDSILVNENEPHRSSVDDTTSKSRFNIMRRRTLNSCNPTKRSSLTCDSSLIVQESNEQPVKQPNRLKIKQKNSNSETKEHTQHLQKKQKSNKRQQTPPQQKMNNQQLLPQAAQAQQSNEKLVNISSFISQCLKIRTKPQFFIQRRSLLHRLYLPFPLKKSVEFIDPNKPKEPNDDKESDKSASNESQNSAPKSALFNKLNEEAKNAFIINPATDKVGYLLNPNSKSGRIIQRFILKSNEMQYDDIEVIADALFELASEYLTKDEIITILFDIIYTTNPGKYPIVQRVNTFWVPYVMDLIPAAINPPYLSEKWKRMTFHELSNTKDWPLRKAVDSLFDLYLHSNPFEIGRCFANTINLVALAVQEMVEAEGGNPADVEIDFDQLFNLLIVCIFSSGLPTITEPLSYASYFDQYACGNNEIHFAMSHMEGLCAHLPKMNFKELRVKSNQLKEKYKEEEKI